MIEYINGLMLSICKHNTENKLPWNWR